ncbi:unnamed protein product [Allacma fusca]|uniref:glucuronosyl-galactosyl-proteoglycan 4-alpha-N-acetylglucosaminyltransferase n=1 Tax=Allacma fusca TaxID=39272 RepID=A0A8J2KX00_9HEXA|nr:unnamed protein product [Allacma fusca]
MKTFKLIALVVFALLFIPLLTHYYLTKVSDEGRGTGEELPEWVSKLVDVDKLKGKELKLRIEELLRIKLSVSAELRGLEAKRQKLQTEISVLNRRLEEAKGEAGRRRNELDRLQMSLQQAKVAEKEAMERNTPRLGRPKPVPPLRYIPVYPYNAKLSNMYCDMDNCFDYSMCPVAGSFSFFLYPLMYTNRSVSGYSETTVTINQLYNILSESEQLVTDPLKACIFVVVVESCDDYMKNIIPQQLPHWSGDGRNHIIWLHCGGNPYDKSFIKPPEATNVMGRAMIVSENFGKFFFRRNFDMVVSHWEKAIPSGEVWSHLPPLVPAKRKYLATYLGGETDPEVQTEFLKIQQQDPFSFVFQFSCDPPMKRNEIDEGTKRLSSLCENDLLRTRLLLDSTFSIILLPPDNMDVVTTKILQLRLYESLKHGSIPVIIGTRFMPPFNEVIDWSKMILILPVSRITEMHYMLKSFPDSDLLEFRKNGRLAFESYFSSLQRVVETLLATFRTRIGIAPLPYIDLPSPNVFNDTFKPLKLDSFTQDPEEEENLGPIEPPYPSPSFSSNFSLTSLQKYDLWNSHYQPFKSFPFSPWDQPMPSEAKFRGSSIGFRPIAGGAGGSGKEFSESLGGNYPKEQFTVVMLTYEREQVLMNSLQRLFAVPYLNKVVVVWNSPLMPAPDLKWPDIGVPIHVVRTEKNSLNNRFLPFDVIETEAILSIDDDAHLRHDEIVFGFRVWRENRDRIVGFPGRFHAWDLNYGGWLYNSNYSCELSMVLTGAAFYHKIYSYLYTYEMPHAIRDKVDELMNCEDIALNFLVSHMTQKPPVKVTSRWTFRCPGCPVTLSEDDSHFQERHHCINFFTKVYGYTPIRYTQFRADSILFKTRIPHDKQKCFNHSFIQYRHQRLNL